MSRFGRGLHRELTTITPASFNFFLFPLAFLRLTEHFSLKPDHQASSNDEEKRDCVASHGNFGVFRDAAKMN